MHLVEGNEIELIFDREGFWIKIEEEEKILVSPMEELSQKADYHFCVSMVDTGSEVKVLSYGFES